MKKILIVTNHSYMLYRFRKEFIARLLQYSEVVISTPFAGHEEDFQKMGCKCICTKMDRRGINPLSDMKLVCSYIRLIAQEKPDAVVTYSIKPNVYMGAICRWKNIPYFTNVQGLGTAFESKKLAGIATIMYKYGLKKAKTVFFENAGDAQIFLNRKIIKKNKITVLSGAGINLNEYEYKKMPNNGHRHFLYLGRIMKEKGIDEWFYAAKKMKKEYGERVVFDLVGFCEEEYKEKIDDLEKQGVIVFHGFQENPIPYYEESTCVVLPSYHEGMSNVLLEAAAIGRPVITTDIPGCREAVLEGESGYVCPPQNAERLYETMNLIMKLSDKQLEAMGMQGRKHMMKHFEKSAVVDMTVEAMKRRE